MTLLALIAVLSDAAGRTLAEPGTTLVPVAGLLGLCIPAPDLSTVEGARCAILDQHDRLVRVALAHDLVPVRSGALFSGRQAVATTLGAQAGMYRAYLDRVSGALEVTLSVATPAAARSQTSSGAAEGLAYLRARRPRPAIDTSPGAERLLAEALAVVAAGLSAQVLSGPGTDGAAATATILVPRARIAAVLSSLARWTDDVAAPAGARVRIQGPWPCYSFTTAEVSHADS